MKKNKIFKALGFSSLALLMACTGVVAFAPLQSTQISFASDAEMTTQQGLITPKADDPIIYTTESGLDIKYGNAAIVALGGGNETQEYETMTSTSKLSGFPYFTTTKGSTTYTWVIIGKSTTMPNNSFYASYDTLANWQGLTSQSPTYKEFFDEIYEEASPAGTLLKNKGVLNNYTARGIKNVLPTSSTIKSNDEIFSGCVLAIANTSVGNSVLYPSINNCTTLAQTFVGTDNTYRKLHASYYTNDTFGFGSLLSQVQETTLKQVCFYTSSNTKTQQEVKLHFFPMGSGSDGTIATQTSGSLPENFQWKNYISSTQWTFSDTVWARSMYNYGRCYNTTPAGENNYQASPYGSYAVRPAFQIKIT